jgi:hypothetical protein
MPLAEEGKLKGSLPSFKAIKAFDYKLRKIKANNVFVFFTIPQFSC